jgi:hypothetical protein
MAVTIDLIEDALERLQAEAGRRGVSIDVVVAELIQSLPADGSAPRKLSFIGLGSSSSGQYARDADDLLADGLGRENLLVVDTSVLLAAADNADPDHDSCTRTIESAGGRSSPQRS